VTDQAKLIKHYTATVYILSDAQPRKALLVHHRKYDHWVPPGGHQEAWENPLETAIREVKEESGLEIAPYLEKPQRVDQDRVYLPQPKYLAEFKIPAHKDELEHYHIDFEYVVYVPEQAVSHQEAEAKGIGWFTWDQLKSMPTYPDIRQVLEQELNQ
jgi:8-oxo-dGTP pyrophosphatase MutT (NUDIX family)